MNAKDNFSNQAAVYRAYRPEFPVELYRFIFSQLNCFDLAWDVATGNGQAAKQLSAVFKRVVATDISSPQLELAARRDNIEYRCEAAEHSSLQPQSCDLVVVSQALHWLRFADFYKEARRVGKPGAVIAAFAYSLVQAVSPELNGLITGFYERSLPYWDPERRYIDEGYTTIPFPFEKIPAPEFSIAVHWSAEQLLGYFASWSAEQHHLEQHGSSMVTPEFTALVNDAIPATGTPLSFPVHLLIGRI